MGIFTGIGAAAARKAPPAGDSLFATPEILRWRWPAGSLSASVILHGAVLVLLTIELTVHYVPPPKPKVVKTIEIVRSPRLPHKAKAKPKPPVVRTASTAPVAPVAPAPKEEAPKGPVPPYQFAADDGEVQELPKVLEKWKGCLAFGDENAPKTFIVKLCGPGFGQKQILAEPAAVADQGYDLDLKEADRWDFVRAARARCRECATLRSAYAIFPYEFGERLDDQLRRRGGPPPGPKEKPAPLVVRFESAAVHGITVQGAAQEGQME